VCQVVAVLVVGTQTVKVHLNQLDVDMKTRQEMIYDFMVALSANGEVYKDWEENIETFGDFSENIQMLAEELADKYLKEQA
jgi:hypothetical protein